MKKFILFKLLILMILIFMIPMFFIPMSTTALVAMDNHEITGTNKIPELVRRFEQRIKEEMKLYNWLNEKEHLPILLAIVSQESGGNTNITADIFQCSESLGLPPNTLSTEASIKQGVKYFAEIYKRSLILKIKDIKYTVQAYNFGIGFLDYINSRNLNDTPFNKTFAHDFAVIKGGNYGDENYVENVFKFLKVVEIVPTNGTFKIAPLVSDNIHFLQPYGEYTDGSGAHYGIDIGDSLGTIVVSVGDGIVDDIIGGSFPDSPNSSPIGTGYGNCVTIKHANNLYTRYAHLKKHSICVKAGDVIKAGTRIGAQGNSGYSFGTHLHFEVRVKDGFAHSDTRNPEEYIKIPYVNKI